MQLLGEISPERPLLAVAVHLEAEHLHTELPVLITGVGKVAAATSLLALLAQLPRDRWPARVVNLGTAGALADDLSGTHVVGTVVQHDLDGPAIAALCGIDPAPPLELGEGPVLATGDAFVADADQRRRLATSASLCDMEGYAIAAAARRAGLDVVLVKHVSDAADESARRSWVDSVAACSESLGRWMATPDGRALIGG
jgi:adenosylhomocysteine nucleosidase